MEQEQRTGIAATISIIASIGSYVLTCTGHPIWALIAAILSIPLGILGFVMAASPRVGGGILSIASICLGALAALIAILGIIGVIGSRVVGY